MPLISLRRCFCVAIIIARCSACCALLAAEPPAPLAALPSGDGAHVAKLKSLASGSWLELGAPAPDPQWGKARGRSWGAKMAFAPDLHACFLTGEGVHGWWNEENGRYMDDLWAYDIPAHRWVCVYPGADVNSLELTLDKHGFETTADGQQLPVAQLGHCYQMTAYNPLLRQFSFVPCEAGYWPKALSRRLKWLEGRKDLKVEGSPGPFVYDAATARWQRRQTDGPGPSTSFGDVWEYIATKAKYFLRDSHHEIWWYDPAENRWEKKSPSGPPPPFGIDPTACYDTKRDRLYIGGGGYPIATGEHAFWIYDLTNDAWINPRPAGKPCGGSNSYSTNNSTMTYDSVSDVVIICRYRDEPDEPRAKLGLWIYHPAENRWEEAARPFPENAEWKCLNACYDPLLNVHIYHSAHDSRDDGVVWAYRYLAQ
ncbi:MAG: hypothetical protein AB7O62_15310 [Pirellulales bacterium]